jgi:hypothetical protein
MVAYNLTFFFLTHNRNFSVAEGRPLRWCGVDCHGEGLATNLFQVAVHLPRESRRRSMGSKNQLVADSENSETIRSRYAFENVWMATIAKH